MMKIDLIKMLIPIGLVLGIIQAFSSFETLHRSLDTIGTEHEWRFYFALAAFTIFSGMLFSLAVVLVVRWAIVKTQATR